MICFEEKIYYDLLIRAFEVFLMAEMVFLQCDIGSRAVYIACPKCGRISRQILRDEYNGGSVALLAKELTCPVCGSVYRACSTSQTR